MCVVGGHAVVVVYRERRRHNEWCNVNTCQRPHDLDMLYTRSVNHKFADDVLVSVSLIMDDAVIIVVQRVGDKGFGSCMSGKSLGWGIREG